MTKRLPDFVLIGAMKCATTTLHRQLADQDGIFMAEKEIGFFRDDDLQGRGGDSYGEYFAGAPGNVLVGESSTDYTKMPTHVGTAARMREMIPDVKLIYVMRHPIDRLVSHYVHDWTERLVSVPLDQAVEDHPVLIDYSRYAMQLRPFLDAFGPQRILLVFFESLVRAPDEEMARIGEFLGTPAPLSWNAEEEPTNVSRDRLRRNPIRDLLVWNPISTWLRRCLVPQRVRDAIKGHWQMKERPKPSPEVRARLTACFDEDLTVLGDWLDLHLACENWKEVAGTARPRWREGVSG